MKFPVVMVNKAGDEVRAWNMLDFNNLAMSGFRDKMEAKERKAPVKKSAAEDVPSPTASVSAPVESKPAAGK